jgi:ankyrin repeat protein
MLQRISIASLVLLLCLSALTRAQSQQVSEQRQKAIEAIKKQNVAELRTLLDEQLDLKNFIDAKDDRYGATLLHWAAAQKYIEAIEELKNRGASLAARNNEEATPLLVAIVPSANSKRVSDEDFLNIIRKLSTSEIVKIPNSDGKTALHLACEYGQTKVVQVLIDEFKADINIATKTGKTPLDYALEERHYEIIKLLKDKGAKTSQALLAATSNTPLHIAASKGNLEEVMNLLKENGDLVNQQNSDRETPLHLAAKNCYPKVVAYLIQQGANVEALDKEGHNFLQIACPKARKVTVINK